MALTISLFILFVMIALYSSRNIFRHTVQMQHEARAERMRAAVDWRTLQSKRKAPKSRISQLLGF